MRLIESSATLVSHTDNAEKLIEKCGRVSHKSESKIDKDSHKYFIEKLVSLGHFSVLEHASATFKIVCDRAISHEIVRHRIASYTQESTRYIKYTDLDIICDNEKERPRLQRVGLILEEEYRRAIVDGVTPEYARAVLPNCVATTLYMTANFRAWREIIEKRIHKSAHPQAIKIFRIILTALYSVSPSTFKDLAYKYSLCS